jgi:hypothetical protein
MRTPLFVATAIFSLSTAAGGQASRVTDQASFTITVNGRTAGRENFRITATTRGDVSVYLARADITYGDRKLSAELTTSEDGGLEEYNVTTRAGTANEKWDGAVTRGRLNATITSTRGTSAREYVVPAGALMLDDEVIHHHWFLTLRSRSGQMPVVVPRRGSVQTRFTMSTVGPETVRIGNHDLPATHVRATDSGGAVHDVWVDQAGRLLKVAVPARGLVAVRDDPPAA